MIAVRRLCARRERAVKTLQKLLACRRSVMDAITTLWERRVDAVRTLCITGKCDVLEIFRGDPTTR